MLYLNQGKYDEAEDYLLRAIMLYYENPDGIPLDNATPLNNLALTYQKTENYESAEEFYLSAQEIYLNYYGKYHWLVATNANNLGVLYWSMGDYRSALKMMLECIDIYNTLSGEDHPDYITLLNNTGYMYWRNGKDDKAEEYFLASIEKIILHIINVFPSMSENEKKQFVARNYHFFENFQVFCLDRCIENPSLLIVDFMNLK